jgi:thiamine-phosphate diphosphorylase
MDRRAIPRLHLVSDRRLCDLETFPTLAARAVTGGVDAVHLREKDVAAGELLATARRLRSVLDTARLFVNDRLDVALLSEADGMQLGESSFSVADARSLGAGRLLIGRSAHDVEGAKRAAEDGADFVIAGHVFETTSKLGQPGRGPRFIESIAAACPLPIIAIGGITPERVADVLAAGAHGVAVISGILAADEPECAAARYAEALAGR